MVSTMILFIAFIPAGSLLCGQNQSLISLDFMIGEWSGEGNGFGNNESEIKSEFKYFEGGQYIVVVNQSTFEPTESNPVGEQHVDKGFISLDKARWTIKRLSENKIETTFDVSFPNKEYSCFGKNHLTKYN